MKKYIYTLFAAAMLCGWQVNAQEVITIEPLFEYPVAPEELPTLQEKSDYLVEHFWDGFDFKAQAVDQNALNDAFRVYIGPIRWATFDKAMKSIDKLIGNYSKNPTLTLQFAKAAEENLYGPRAEIWIDEVYLKFLNALLSNKKIQANRKKKYETQLKTIEASKIGFAAPRFEFIDKEGTTKKYFPMSTPTLIIFGNPYDTDWRLTRLRMETNLQLTDALEKGKINIIYMVPGIDGDWVKETSSYPSTWIVGYSDDVKNVFDLRSTPCVYVIGGDGKIIQKNISLDAAIQTLLSQLSNQ